MTLDRNEEIRRRKIQQYIQIISNYLNVDIGDIHPVYLDRFFKTEINKLKNTDIALHEKLLKIYNELKSASMTEL